MFRKGLSYRVARVGRYDLGAVYEKSGFWDHLDDDDPQLSREDTLEMVRMQLGLETLPCRKDAFFAWPTREEALKWLRECSDTSERVVYVIEPLPSSKVLVADYGWLALTVRSLEEWEARANAYWSGEQRPEVSRWEVVIEGPVAIRDIIEDAEGGR